MKTNSFTYTDESNNLPTQVWGLVRAWADRRRRFRIEWCITARSVTVWLTTPSTDEHNRAVQSLARILDRAVLKNSLNLVS
jgi:hypothetical protein